jgi:hypothetical protein
VQPADAPPTPPRAADAVQAFFLVLGAGEREAYTYSTKTRGERYQPPARPVAQGEYELVRHDEHVHLSYRVDPTGDRDVLVRDVGVAEQGSFVLLFKRRRGRGVWTTEGDPLAELDREDAEVVLVAASADDRLDAGGDDPD